MHVRLLDELELGRHLGGVVHLDQLAGSRGHLVGDVRSRDQQVEVELALEALADDLHVQQAEESATEPEPERLRRLGVVRQGRVVETKLLERIAERRVLVGVRREDPGEDHRLHVLVPGKRLGRGPAARRQRVSDAQPRDVLEPGDDVPDLAGGEGLDRLPRGGHEAELLRLELRTLRHCLQRLARLEPAVDDAHEGDDAAVLVVGRVEDQGARRRVRVAGGRRDPVDDRVEHVSDAVARLRRDPEDAVRRLADERGELERGLVRIGLRKVDLVGDGDDLELVVEREIGVGERLRLDPLRGVDEQERPLARLQGARHLVAEVDVAGGVDQIQLVAAPRDPHGLRLDRDAALALEIHRVEQLLAHLARRDGAGQLEDAIRERRLAVVDVRDDREVANAVLLHRTVRRLFS